MFRTISQIQDIKALMKKSHYKLMSYIKKGGTYLLIKIELILNSLSASLFKGNNSFVSNFLLSYKGASSFIVSIFN